MKLVRTVLTLALALAVTGCGGSDAPPAEGVPPAGQWYAGDFHVHTSLASNDTRYPDGSLHSFPEAIRETAIARGMSFVVLTDHSNSAGSIVDTTVEDGRQWNQGPEFPLWDLAAQLSDARFLMIDGSEISPVSTLDAAICEHCPTLGTGMLTPVGHIGCVPEDLATFDRTGAFIDRPPGGVTGGSCVAQCQARNGFTIINHPFYRATPWIDYDWTSFDYDAIEVWNGSAGFTGFDRQAYDAYVCDRLAGRPVVAVGGSDNHRTPLPYADPVTVDAGPPLGLPMTSVFAERLEWPAIMNGLRRGRIVIHELGTFVEFRVGSNGADLGGIGDTLALAGTTATLYVRGQSPRPQELRIVHVAPDGCTERRQPGSDVSPRVASTVVHSEIVCPTDACSFEHDVVVTLASGLYYATVGEYATANFNARDIAVTNALVVAEAEVN